MKASSCASPAESPPPPDSSSVSSPLGSELIPVLQAQVADGFDDALIGDGRVEEGQVLAHRGVEELDVLGDHAHAAAQLLHWKLADIHRLAVGAQVDAALIRIIQAEEQAGEGGLALSRCAQAGRSPGQR